MSRIATGSKNVLCNVQAQPTDNFNPYHGEDGRFTESTGASSTTFRSKEHMTAKQHTAMAAHHKQVAQSLHTKGNHKAAKDHEAAARHHSSMAGQASKLDHFASSKIDEKD